MTRPSVAIVGRPNVGKSSLLNALAGARISIVDPTRLARDRRIAPTSVMRSAASNFVDTGGIGVV
jgi:predicted GTPase